MVMASDGYYDTMTDQALLEVVGGLSIKTDGFCPTAVHYMDGLCDRMFEDALKPGTGFYSRGGHPVWDDISIWVVQVTSPTWFIDKVGEVVDADKIPDSQHNFILGKDGPVLEQEVKNVTESRCNQGVHSRSNKKFRKKRDARKRRCRHR